ncbi:hypothetical protein BH24CHL5_BH24CHL5_12830 [soil metagenome]
MARAKNTSRAEARRRTREQIRAEQGEAIEGDALSAAEDGTLATSEASRERPRLFKMPDFRADLAAVPAIMRSRRLMIVPPLLLLIGFVLMLTAAALPAGIVGIVDLYVQFFFVPPALFTFFIAGFVAPRASYLFGLIYGLAAGVMWSILIVNSIGLTGGTTPTSDMDPVTVFGQMLIIGALYGTLAAAFAAWYRDFLRGMQERGKARRAEREAQDRTKRRDQRQESRKVSKRS